MGDWARDSVVEEDGCSARGGAQRGQRSTAGEQARHAGAEAAGKARHAGAV